MSGDDKGKIKSIMPEIHKYSFTDSVCFGSEIVVAWLVKGDLLLMMFKTDEDEVLFRLFISVWRTCVSFSSRIFRCCYKKQWSWMNFWEINKQFRYSQTSKKYDVIPSILPCHFVKENFATWKKCYAHTVITNCWTLIIINVDLFLTYHSCYVHCFF